MPHLKSHHSESNRYIPPMTDSVGCPACGGSNTMEVKQEYDRDYGWLAIYWCRDCDTEWIEN